MAYITWNETTPPGSEARSLGDDRIRELKIQIRERLEEVLINDMDADPVVLKSGFISLVSGTKMVFFQAAAPADWTQDTTHNDKALRVVSGTGAGSGGSSSFATGAPAHTHTGPSHTHDINESGELDATSLGGGGGSYDIPHYGATAQPWLTTAGGTGNTSEASAWAPYYADVIICSKD